MSWRLESLARGEDIAARLALLGERERGGHYGAYFRMPGAAFLALFSRSSGPALARAVLFPAADRASALKDLEPAAVAEVANILVNAVAGALADAIEMPAILSAPELLSDARAHLLAQAAAKFAAGSRHPIMAVVELHWPALEASCTLLLFFSYAWKDLLVDRAAA